MPPQSIRTRFTARTASLLRNAKLPTSSALTRSVPIRADPGSHPSQGASAPFYALKTTRHRWKPAGKICTMRAPFQVLFAGRGPCLRRRADSALRAVASFCTTGHLEPPMSSTKINLLDLDRKAMAPCSPRWAKNPSVPIPGARIASQRRDQIQQVDFGVAHRKTPVVQVPPPAGPSTRPSSVNLYLKKGRH